MLCARHTVEEWLTKSSTTNWLNVDPDEIKDLIAAIEARDAERDRQIGTLIAYEVERPPCPRCEEEKR